MSVRCLHEGSMLRADYHNLGSVVDELCLGVVVSIPVYSPCFVLEVKEVHEFDVNRSIWYKYYVNHITSRRTTSSPLSQGVL